MAAMAPPLGQWNVVTNLNNGLLNVTNVDASGNVTGTIQLSPTDTYNISGTWDGTKNELKFSYSFIITSGGLHIPFFINFDGYLFEAGQPLFNTTVGPTTAHWYMLAGTWQHTFSIQPHANGWVARQLIQ
jgi:hypothetical protein